MCTLMNPHGAVACNACGSANPDAAAIAAAADPTSMGFMQMMAAMQGGGGGGGGGAFNPAALFGAAVAAPPRRTPQRELTAAERTVNAKPADHWDAQLEFASGDDEDVAVAALKRIDSFLKAHQARSQEAAHATRLHQVLSLVTKSAAAGNLLRCEWCLHLLVTLSVDDHVSCNSVVTPACS